MTAGDKTRRFLGNTLALLLISATTLWANPIPSYAANGLDVMDRQREQVQPAPRSLPKMIITEEGKTTDADVGALFTLNTLMIEGATVFPQEELLAPYAELFGKKITLSKVYQIAAELTKKYRDAGYLLSRVVIPEQQVDQSGASIRLFAVEGFIEAIQYSGDERVLENFKSYFSPAENRILSQKPLKHSVLERYLLLMQDLPGINVSSRFQKGATPGASILLLEVQGNLVEGSLSWGNTGTDSSGPGVASAGIAVNSLPIIGSKTSLNYSQANDPREYWSLQVTESYQMWNGLTFKASYAYSDSPEQDTDFARTFDYTTQSHTFNLGVSYPIIRSRDLNLSVGLNYEHRNSEADVFDERFTKDRLRTLSTNLNFDFSDVIGGVTQIIPTLYCGLDVFDASDESLEASNSLAPAEFWKFGVYASRNQQLPYKFSLFTAAEVQLSDTTLASYNKFFLGGMQFGRGYDPGIVEGDNGVALSAELRWTHHFTDKRGFQIFSFYDWGRVWTNKSVVGSPDDEDGSSVGAGVRFWWDFEKSWTPNLNITAFLAQPLERAGDDDGNSPRAVVQFSLGF